MTWQLLLTIYLVLNTATYLLQRKLGQTLAEHKRLVSAFFFLAIHYPLGLVVAICSSANLSVGWFNIAMLIIGSWVFPLVNVLSLKASKTVDAGHFTILSNITPVITIAAATLLLDERLSHNQFYGAAIIITSAFIITLPRLHHHARSRVPGILIALICFLLAGLATVYERWILTRMDFGAYLVFGLGAQTAWMTVAAWPERKNLYILKDREHFPAILGYALSSSVKGVCFVVALSLSSASVVSAFISFTAIMVVAAAYFILKERDWLWLKLAAAITGTLGLIILNLA